LDDKQKTNEEGKASSLTQRRVVRIRHSKTLRNLLKVFRTFNMIMDLIPRKNKTVRLKRQARTKGT